MTLVVSWFATPQPHAPSKSNALLSKSASLENLPDQQACKISLHTARVSRSMTKKYRVNNSVTVRTPVAACSITSHGYEKRRAAEINASKKSVSPPTISPRPPLSLQGKPRSSEVHEDVRHTLFKTNHNQPQTHLTYAESRLARARYRLSLNVAFARNLEGGGGDATTSGMGPVEEYRRLKLM